VKIVTVLAMALVVSVGCVLLKSYYLVVGASATLYWRGDDAYLFLGTSSTGYHFRYIDYPVVALREYLNAPISPADDRVSSTVIHVTPSGVEHYQLDFGREAAAAPDFLTPFDDGFYAMCSLALCKWAGDHFDPATEEERRRHGGTNSLFHGDINNQVVNGWSVREIRRLPGDRFDVNIANKYEIHAENHATNVRAYPWISVELVRSGISSEVLYNVDGNPRTVSKGEYRRLFGSL
jgi:hypothetical protein